MDVAGGRWQVGKSRAVKESGATTVLQLSSSTVPPSGLTDEAAYLFLASACNRDAMPPFAAVRSTLWLALWFMT
jgi:hypothetical protein